MKSSDLLELSRELTRQNQAHAWITVISVTSPSSSYVGAQAIVRSDGELSGWIGGGCVQSAARAAALRSIASAVPQRLRLSNTKDPSEAIDVRPMACASNGEVELFIQPAAVAPRLRIYGNTPIVRIAAWLAREADFDPLTDRKPRMWRRWPIPRRRLWKRNSVTTHVGLSSASTAPALAQSLSLVAASDGPRNLRPHRHPRRRRRARPRSRPPLLRPRRVSHRQQTQSRATPHRHEAARHLPGPH